jgi:hypothetical protein
MNQEQIDIVNLVQEVLRGVLVSACALNPDALPRVAQGLRAAATRPGASPMAAHMLADLATGLEMLESAQRRKQ